MITAPQAVNFANAKLRRFSDLLAQSYDAATIILNLWNANGGSGILPPTTVTPTGSTTGGTLTAGVKSYKVSALNALGETLCSSAATVTTTGSTGSVSVAWTAVAGATSYNVYGRTAGNELLIGNALTSPFVDTGAANPNGQQPGTNTTGLIPNDSETINDGSATDGRLILTGAKAVTIVTRAQDIKNWMEGSAAITINDGSKAVLNTVLQAAVNQSSGI